MAKMRVREGTETDPIFFGTGKIFQEEGRSQLRIHLTEARVDIAVRRDDDPSIELINLQEEC